MNLTFKRLRINNFKSIIEADLKLDRQPGLHFIRGENLVEPRLGSNGAGKTTLFDALCWVLFGKTAGGLRNPDIVPWGDKKPTTIAILEFGVGTEWYQLCRTYNHGTLTLDGDQCSQEEIESLLGFNFDLFTNAIILAQGQPLFFDLQPKGKMQLFTDVLSLDKWETRAETAKNKAEDYDRKVTNAAAQVESLKSELATVKDMHDEYSERSAEWKDKREQQLVSLKADLKEEAGRLESIQDKHDKASVAYDEAATKLKLMRTDRDELYKEVMRTERAYNSHEDVINRAEAELREQHRLLKKASTVETCPTCGQTITNTNLEDYEDSIKTKIKELEKVLDADIPKDVVDAYAEAKAALQRQLDSEEEFDKQAFECRQQVDYLTPDLARAKAEVRRLQSNLDELEQQTNPYREQVSKLAEKITIIKEDIEDSEDYAKRMRQKAERCRYWVKGFKDIRLFVIEEVLDELELASKVILEELGLIGWTIEYDVERETKSGTIQRGINIAIRSPSAPSPVKWESWSGGEGQRLRLVGALALSEVLLGYAGIDTNLEILDEPTRHLSKEGVRDIWGYLADRATRLDRVCLYIDHQSVESARFASVVTVSKDEAGIHIREE